MSDLQAEPLSPIDAATLWPQLHLLNTEVIALRSDANLLMRAGVSATGLTRLLKVARTTVLGVRHRMGYRGVIVARELAGQASWEISSLRISRETDDEAVSALVDAASIEIARRGGHGAFLRLPEGSPHYTATTQAGFAAYTSEQLYARPPSAPPTSIGSSFREVAASDHTAVFQLYCRSVPESVRRQEAVTQQQWRAIHDIYSPDQEFVVEKESNLFHRWLP